MDKFTKSYAPLKLIERTEFGIMSPDVVEKMSVAEIEYVEMFENKMPKIGSLCDPRMGCVDQNMTCYTCEENYNNCPGHFGHINLATPVYHIGFLKTVKKVLECICHKCSRFRLLPTDNRYKKLMSVKNKFQYAWDYCKTKTVCEYSDCEAQILPLRKYGLQLYYDVKKGDKSDKIYLFADTAREILSKITDDTCWLMGLNPKTSRPEWMIITVLSVPPPCIRPAVKMDMGEGRGEDDLTHVLTNIIKYNNELKKNKNMRSNNNIYAKNMEALQYNVVTYFDNDVKTGIKQNTQRGNRPIKSITSRLKGKEGRIRGNIMGKRVDFSARTVITGDPTLSIGELGVPKSIAANLTFPEKVNNINREKLQKLIDNSPEYPSAKYLLKDSGVRIDLRYAKNKPSIEIGDTVDRHLVDGDTVLFNRQPTLHKMSMMAHKIKVMPFSTFRMNVNVCSSYNADFDGDEMNIHAPQSIECIAELQVLSSVENLLVSAQANKPVNSLVQDSITAIRKFTQRDLFIEKTQVMDLMMVLGLMDIPTPAILKPIALWTGKQIMSLILPRINFVGFHSAHPDDESKQDDFTPSDTKVLIQNGILISGILCKKTVGTSSGGILHIIFNDHGPIAARKFLDSTSQMLNQWLLHDGFSVGIGDALINEASQHEMTASMKKIEADINQVIKKYKDGTIVCQGTLSIEETKENQIQSLLAKARDDAGRTVNKAAKKYNNVKQMVESGAKGSIMNICQISACVGQQVVEGKRLPMYFKNRSLPHFEEFDDSPESRGFVKNSFLKGLQPYEMFFHAMGGREGVIDTAVKSVSYDTTIIIIENNQPKYVKIGEWIDSHLETNPSDIKHHSPEQMNMELLEIKSSVSIPTVDSKGNVFWTPLTCVTRHDPGEHVYEIKTYGGRRVVVAKSKSLLIWNPLTKEFIEKDTPDVKIGDFVPVNQYLPSPHVVINSIYMGDYFPKTEYIHGTEFNKALKLMDKDHRIPVGWWDKNNGITFITPYKTKASLQRAKIRSLDLLDGYIYPFHASRAQSKITEYFPLNRENGRFIGLFLADGDASCERSVCISYCDPTVRNWVKNWFDKNGINYDEQVREMKWGTSSSVRGNSLFFKTFLDTILGNGSKNKHVPDVAFCANEDFIKGIIEGYFSGDGTVGENYISASSASERLIEGISSLLNRFGIFGRIRKTHCPERTTKNILPANILEIRSHWAKTFSETFTFILPEKNEKLKQLKTSDTHRNFDTQGDVVLDKIIEINMFGTKEYPKLYDVTVPSTLNFCIANGMQMRDTATTGMCYKKRIN
jgi:DNA-directed RNA polymerase beta' subunit/intein/homing endonuclease